MALLPYRRDPWKALDSMRKELDRMLTRPFDFLSETAEEAVTPSVDVWEDEENVYVEADMPGFEQKDISLNLRGNNLILSAKREEKKEEKKKNYYRSERYTGSVSRTIDLPAQVDESRVNARFKNGVLNVTLPKKEEEKKKEIKIDVD
ncbi:MAG: archaeal heat shock protein Hsp14 [Spirochaetota bacterium]